MPTPGKHHENGIITTKNLSLPFTTLSITKGSMDKMYRDWLYELVRELTVILNKTPLTSNEFKSFLDIADRVHVLYLRVNDLKNPEIPPDGDPEKDSAELSACPARKSTINS